MFNSLTLWLHGPAVLQKLDLARQQKAARKLGRLRDLRAVRLLLRSLADPITWSRSDSEGILDTEHGCETGHLVAALVASGDAAGEPMLDAIREKRGDHFRECLAGALGQIGEYRAIGVLVTLLWDEAEGVRKAAADALPRLRWKPDGAAQEAALAAARFDFEGAVKFGPAAVRPLGLWLLGRGTTSHCQCEAARALARIGDPLAIEPLKRLIAEGKFDTRFSPSAGEVAVEALSKLGGSGVQVVVEVLRTHNPKLRAAAAKALGTADRPETVAALGEGLFHSHAVVTEACAAALGSMTTPPAREVSAKWAAGKQKQKSIIAGGQLEQFLNKNFDDAKMIEGVYQLALSRRPRPEERASNLAFVAQRRERRQAWRDLLWQLMWSREFFGL